MSTPFYKHTVAYAVSGDGFKNRQVAIFQTAKIKATVEEWLTKNDARKKGDWFLVRSEAQWAEINIIIKGSAIGGVIFDLAVEPSDKPIIFLEYVVAYTFDQFTKRRIATFDDAEEKAKFQDFLTAKSAVGHGDWFVLSNDESVDIATDEARNRDATVYQAVIRS